MLAAGAEPELRLSALRPEGDGPEAAVLPAAGADLAVLFLLALRRGERGE